MVCGRSFFRQGSCISDQPKSGYDLKLHHELSESHVIPNKLIRYAGSLHLHVRVITQLQQCRDQTILVNYTPTIKLQGITARFEAVFWACIRVHHSGVTFVPFISLLQFRLNVMELHYFKTPETSVVIGHKSRSG